jgi:hypothetical protein
MLMKTSKTRSTFEKTVLSELDREGIHYLYEPDKIVYQVERYYVPDLLINDIYIELKGYFREDAQRKMRAVKAQHPDLDIRFVFQNSKATIQGAKKRKDGSKMTCAEWADRYGFIWSHLRVPKEWIQ